MPRPRGAGCASSVWSAHRAVATFGSPLHQVRPPTDRPDAAIHQRGHLRSGTRRHLCVSAVKANGYTLQGHSAPESIEVVARHYFRPSLTSRNAACRRAIGATLVSVAPMNRGSLGNPNSAKRTYRGLNLISRWPFDRAAWPYHGVLNAPGYIANRKESPVSAKVYASRLTVRCFSICPWFDGTLTTRT